MASVPSKLRFLARILEEFFCCSEAFIIDIIELNRGNGIGTAEPFTQIHLPATVAAERRMGGGSRLGTDRACGHYAAAFIGANSCPTLTRSSNTKQLPRQRDSLSGICSR